MPAPVEFTITMSALPVGFHGDPQVLADAIVARLTITPSEPWSSFVNGGAEPTSNLGPWLKNGNQWKVWDDGLGAYTDPIVAGATIPDGSLTLSKLALQTAGSTIIAVGGGAVSALAPGTAGYVLTMSGGLPAWAPVSTPAPFSVYPAQATNSVPQSIPTDGTPTKVLLDQAPVNPAPVPFDTTNHRYVVPATGIYGFSASSQFDNNTGTAATMEVSLTVYINGSDAGLADIDSTPSPNGNRWSPGFGVLMANLTAGDVVELYAGAADGGSNTINLTTTDFSIFRVSA